MRLRLATRDLPGEFDSWKLEQGRLLSSVTVQSATRANMRVREVAWRGMVCVCVRMMDALELKRWRHADRWVARASPMRCRPSTMRATGHGPAAS